MEVGEFILHQGQEGEEGAVQDELGAEDDFEWVVVFLDHIEGEAVGDDDVVLHTVSRSDFIFGV